MNRWFCGLCFAFCVLGAGDGDALVVPIDDVQQYDESGSPESPYHNQVVTVEGRIYVVKGTYSNGGHYIQDATGGINVFDPSAPDLTYGDRIRVTGVIWTYVGELYMDNPTITFLGHEAEPSPVSLSVGALISDYESVGSFMSVTGTVANRSWDRFDLVDGGDSVPVIIRNETGISIDGVDNGDRYTVFGPCFNIHGVLWLAPRIQSDLVEIVSGGTIVVDTNGGGDAVSIQAGIDMATAGDVVLVTDGVYYEHDITMKSGVTLRSQSGSNDGVVIDAEYQGRVMVCDGVNSSTRIEGMMLIRGLAPGTWPDNVGAGITCRNSAPTIINCTICMSVATYGGGIFCDNSSPVIVGCTIAHNDANFGSGVFCSENSHPSLENTLIAFNSTSSAIDNSSGSSVDLSCCNIFGSDGGNWVGDIASQLGILGNISEDPQFCYATPELHLNWSLQSDSPCTPAHSECGLIGASDVGCAGTPTVQTSWGIVKTLYK